MARLWSDPPALGIGTPLPDGGTEPSAAVGLLQGSLSWYTGAVAVLAVLIAAGRMAWSRRGRSMADLLRGLATLVLVSAAGVTAVTLFAGAGDLFAAWILDRTTDDVEAAFVDLVALPEADAMPAVLAILLGSAAMIGAVLQIVLLIARGAVLVVLTGVLPLTASATNTDTGRAVFVRTMTWLAAFVLYQPVAALIYATGFLVAPDPAGSPVVAALVGTTFVGLAIAALPALLRLLRPVALAAAGVGGRTSPAGSSLPSGARAVSPVTLVRERAVLQGPVLRGVAAMPSRPAVSGPVDARTARGAVARALPPGRAGLPEARRDRVEAVARDVPAPRLAPGESDGSEPVQALRSAGEDVPT